ncbi:Crp/Fnr family transcriptional regulator [Shewanella profunda]|uniref:Crp/Fnr family transcriptional regulator n=1 Tax=Shewanella profunda TaxID=254793 RepID=UPI00200E1563|nr:Crp/Fnr family transcriptional regulator [Shewanella profunda]MCL1091659.1 Crp/Fnr family transcriptional regulator [Shewanella profunda]
MSTTIQDTLEPQVQNLLIRHLPVAEQANILSQAELIQLNFADLLCQPGESYQYVYFPLTAFISLIAKLPKHPALEMGLIGYEGMLGATTLLSTRQVPSEAIIQGSGKAWRIPIAIFEELLAQSSNLRLILETYLHQLLCQLSQNAVCAHFHSVESRLARWLLMSHDRIQSNELFLTHKFLSDMLGVRRSSITEAAGELQNSGCISYNRGRLHILDRQGLLARCCSCYRTMRT